jgi:hypothetical protein
MTDNPQLKRDQAFALFLARNHAHNNGKPLPDPSTIRPLGFTKVEPSMNRGEINQNLLEVFRRNGITVKLGQDQEDTG